MNCAFCNSQLIKENTRSIEHIIPESLGNKEYILSPRLICDKCNNYFAREIEKPFLENSTIKLLRSYELLPNKKDKYPEIPIMFNEECSALEYDKQVNAFFLGLSPACIGKTIINPPKELFMPLVEVSSLKDNYIVSRFLCKVFTEYLLNILSRKYKRKSYIVKAINKDKQMRELFDFVRQGNQNNYYKYDVICFKTCSSNNRDPIIAIVDFIKTKEDFYFMLRWSCLEFKLFMTTK